MTPAQFKATRDALCLSQADLAAIWGTTPRAIGRWERGEVPMNTVAAYCLALMLSLERPTQSG